MRLMGWLRGLHWIVDNEDGPTRNSLEGAGVGRYNWAICALLPGIWVTRLRKDR